LRIELNPVRASFETSRYGDRDLLPVASPPIPPVHERPGVVFGAVDAIGIGRKSGNGFIFCDLNRQRLEISGDVPWEFHAISLMMARASLGV
jgi:hypothetical protein